MTTFDQDLTLIIDYYNWLKGYHMQATGNTILGEIKPPGIMEGGDIVWLRKSPLSEPPDPPA